jgi:ATP-dependent DNA helicase RecQ
MLDALKKYFGFSEFRPLQREIVEAVMAKNDVFALMPTGAGKSLCFQLPAVLMPGITIVISPLIALMKDQVDSLNESGIPATFLNSSLEYNELHERMRGLERGDYKLLYIAPERFPVAGFLDFLQGLNVALCVVDEAHCISEWGHDFRADYRNLRILRERFPNAPIMAVTATATEQVLEDIVGQLHLREPEIFRASFDRKNLIYQVWPKRSALAQLTGYLEKKKGESGIIYCLSRDGTEKMAESLRAHGFNAMAYHAGLEKSRRTRVQEQFDRDKVNIICATIAFGMGIDKPDIRFVIHYDIPKSIPGYYQETGRAGRDGLGSDCILFYKNGDRQKLLYFFEDKPPEERARSIYELDQMVDLAEAGDCRRKRLLAYFGEQYPLENCGSCDNCMSHRTTTAFDGTRLAQMFLSCMVRVNQKFGEGHIVNILLGSQRQNLIDWGHHNLSTYGIGKDYTRDEWRHFAHEFRRQGLTQADHERFSVLRVTKKGWQVLKEGLQVQLTRPEQVQHVVADATSLPPVNTLLFEELRQLRRSLADAKGIPPFVIFHDSTLRDMAARAPIDGQTFLRITGVGERKAKDYGTQFITCIRKFRSEHPELAPVNPAPRTTIVAPAREPKGGDSALTTLALFKRGLSPKEIAANRDLAISTINGHLASLLEGGQIESLERLVEPTKAESIRAAFNKGFATLTEIKEHLGDGYSFEEMRFVKAFETRRRIGKLAAGDR